MGAFLSRTARGSLLVSGTRRLHDAGVTTARLDARLLLQHAAGLDHAALLAFPETDVSAREADAFARLVTARAEGVPLAHLTGRREFWSLDLEAGPGALIPRPETEGLVEALLMRLPDGPATLVDVGTGTGCILAALLTERRHDSGIGIDMDGGALRIARRNLTRHAPHRFALVRGRWLDAIAGPVDAIASNPPYIPTRDLAGLSREVRQDPIGALDGGPDGLGAYRALTRPALDRLRPGGWLAYEIGRHQARDVVGMMETAGFAEAVCLNDLAGIERIVLGRRAA